MTRFRRGLLASRKKDEETERLVFTQDTATATDIQWSSSEVGDRYPYWTAGYTYRIEFDYEITAVNIVSQPCQAQFQSQSANAMFAAIDNPVVGMTGHVNSTWTNNSTRSRRILNLRSRPTGAVVWSATITNIKLYLQPVLTEGWITKVANYGLNYASNWQDTTFRTASGYTMFVYRVRKGVGLALECDPTHSVWRVAQSDILYEPTDTTVTLHRFWNIGGDKSVHYDSEYTYLYFSASVADLTTNDIRVTILEPGVLYSRDYKEVTGTAITSGSQGLISHLNVNTSASKLRFKGKITVTASNGDYDTSAGANVRLTTTYGITPNTSLQENGADIQFTGDSTHVYNFDTIVSKRTSSGSIGIMWRIYANSVDLASILENVSIEEVNE